MIESITIINNRTLEELELSMIETPFYILQSIDFGNVESEYKSNSFVNQIGEYVSSRTIGQREVEVIGWVVSETIEEMKSRKYFLNSFFNLNDSFSIVYDEYKLDVNLETSIKYTNTKENENNEYMCKFKIDCLAPYPLFLSKEKIIERSLTINNMFHFPLIFNSDLNAVGQVGGVVFGNIIRESVFNSVNEGDVPIGCIIELEATADVVNPKITSIYTQEFFKIEKTMVAGEKIVINSKPGEKSILGTLNGDETNYFEYKSNDSTWVTLNPGDNVFVKTADSGADSLLFTIYRENAYFEVQR